MVWYRKTKKWTDVETFESAQMSTNGRGTPTLHAFNEDNYEREWLLIGRFLSTMTAEASWTKKEVTRIRKKAYKFFL